MKNHHRFKIALFGVMSLACTPSRSFAQETSLPATQRGVVAGKVAPPHIQAMDEQMRARMAEVMKNDAESQRELTPAEQKEKITQLRAVIASHPNDPKNMPLQFQIARILEEADDGALRPTSGPDACNLEYLDILSKYDHKRYYESAIPLDWDSPEFMMPRAAIRAAQFVPIEFRNDKDAVEKGRKYAVMALDFIQWTYEKRREDWQTAPFVPYVPLHDSLVQQSMSDNARAIWEKRKADGASGNVFGTLEMQVVDAAVRQYGRSFDAKTPEEVRTVMQQIIDKYANSALAKVAAEYKKVGRLYLPAPQTQPKVPNGDLGG